MHQHVNLTRRKFLKLGGLGLMAGAGYGTLVEPNRLSLERVTVRIPRLPTALEGIRIAVLSDFHLHPFTKLPHIQDGIRVANGLRPDMVVLLGDYVDSTVEAIHELAPALASLNARMGLFAILGNHDQWKGAQIVQSTLEKFGIHVLRNSGLSLSHGGSDLFLAGLESASYGFPNMNSAFNRRRQGVPTILLIHEPDFGDTAAADGRVSLQLSGHSHGGQVRLPLIGALELPIWGKKYDHGLYQLGKMALYTNRGIGLVDIPVRFNCPPEVTEITLCSA